MGKRSISRVRTSNKVAAQERGYPRPQLLRKNWTNLNGRWKFAIDPEARATSAHQIDFNSEIEVPFAPETPASGVEDTGFYRAVWYMRKIPRPQVQPNERVILHLGAVDHAATVWVNGQAVATHEGGYTPFSVDITNALSLAGDPTVVVRAYDDPHDLAKPRGKQDWRLEPHSIWYPRTTGIWQTVWMEVVPETRVERIRWTADVSRWEIGLKVNVAGPVREGLRLRVRLSAKGNVLVEDTYSLSNDEVSRAIALSDPGIDDLRNELMWFPSAPNLIDAQLELVDASGQVIDSVASYTAMRQVSVQGDRLVLNGRPIMLRFLLDQGYWKGSGLTAPDEQAYVRDIELVKSMGFNGVRKHQKIEDPRFLYWADQMGLLVWEEMPSPYRFCPESIGRLTREWTAAIERDASHPCIIAWVPFNESWGVPDLPEARAQRDFVAGIYHLTRALDPTRPVIGNDGWEMHQTDIVAIHDYERTPPRLLERYRRTPENLHALFAYERPGHKQLLIDGESYNGCPIMLTEFGGIAYHKDVKHTWGYKRASTASEFGRQYSELLAAVRALPMFSGFCYTQFTDTYQEANGLVYMDRTPKLPVEQIRKATSG